MTNRHRITTTLHRLNPLSRTHAKHPLVGVALAGLVLAPAAATTTAAAHPAPHTGSHTAASIAQLEPTGTYGEQSHVALNADQMNNARQIVDAAQSQHLPPYAAVISVATSLQETKLKNLGTAVDHDSLGLFQQRPSCGWGTPAQLTNPTYAADAFLNAMKKAVPNFANQPLWQDAQATQQSAFPTRYAQWEDQAAHIVQNVLDGH